MKRVNELTGSLFLRSLLSYLGIKESDTGLAPPALWDLVADKVCLSSTFLCFHFMEIF